MYYGTINYNELWNWLKESPASFAMSFNGKQGENDRTHEVPKELYSQHHYIPSGISSFRRLKNKGAIDVNESLYLNLKK